MKRHFVTCAAVFFGLAIAALGQTTNLQIILEGPFAVCEDATRTPHVLTIYIPNLQNTHYPAGFSSELNIDVPGDGSTYPSYPDGSDYIMNIKRNHAPTALMVLKPINAKVPVHFYSENGLCPSTGLALESFSLQVPDPDEVWALNPAEDTSYVVNHKTGKPIGPKDCTKDPGCNYATKIVLHYLDIDPTSVCIEDPNDTSTSCASMGKNAWTPDYNGAIAGRTEREFEITVSAEPIPEKDYQPSAQAAFRLASNLSGVSGSREIHYTTHRMLSPVTHRVCQVPQLFVCKTGTACNQP